MRVSPDLYFDGQQVVWNGKGAFKATSGLPGFQTPADQCKPEKGPVPEGLYVLKLLGSGKLARDDGTGWCNLMASWQFESIPRGASAGECEPYWEQWGRHRIRFEPADASTRAACKPRRHGFYLHDSTKGFSHGCIEVDGAFFNAMQTEIRSKRKTQLLLRIRYMPGRPTNGGTKQ